jgi:hypothetical protein
MLPLTTRHNKIRVHGLTSQTLATPELVAHGPRHAAGGLVTQQGASLALPHRDAPARGVHAHEVPRGVVVHLLRPGRQGYVHRLLEAGKAVHIPGPPWTVAMCRTRLRTAAQRTQPGPCSGQAHQRSCVHPPLRPCPPRHGPRAAPCAPPASLPHHTHRPRPHATCTRALAHPARPLQRTCAEPSAGAPSRPSSGPSSPSSGTLPSFLLVLAFFTAASSSFSSSSSLPSSLTCGAEHEHQRA